MARREKNKEELTTKMHSEFGVDNDTRRKHVTWTALSVIASGFMSEAVAMKKYNVTDKEIEKYTAEYDELSDD